MQNQDSKPAGPAPDSDPGFKLPGSDGRDRIAPPPGGLETAPPPPGRLATAPPGLPAAATDTSARELAIGGGVFLILVVVFFFVRNAYTQHLVVRRVAPSAAGSAGWLLFLGLAFLSAAAVLALINASRYLTLAVTGPLLLVGVAALAGALLVGRR